MPEAVKSAAVAGGAARLPAWRRWRRRWYFGLARGTLGLTERTPPVVGRAFCVALARGAMRIRPAEREQALANIAAALPALDNRGRKRLLRESVDALGRNLYDALAVPRHLADDFAAVADPPDAGGETTTELLRRLGAQQRGVLVLTGHIGCWELLGAYLARQLPRLAVVTGRIHNAPVDELIQRRRRAWGLTVLPRDAGPRPVVRHLRAGGLLAVLLDQNTRVASRPVEFFGRPAPTPSGFAKLALRYGVPAVPVAIARDGDRHVVRHLEPLWPAKGAGGVPRPTEAHDAVAVDAYLRRCNAALETLIRRNPAEWVWFHRRWAAPPPGGRSMAGAGPRTEEGRS